MERSRPEGIAKSEKSDESRVAGGIPGSGIFGTHSRSLALEVLRCIAEVRFEFMAREVRGERGSVPELFLMVEDVGELLYLGVDGVQEPLSARGGSRLVGRQLLLLEQFAHR